MKNSFLFFFLIVSTSFIKPALLSPVDLSSASDHLVVVTIDGLRWQELFNGADSFLLNSERYTDNQEFLKSKYWGSTVEERRRKLFPFFWNVMSSQGQLHGNRNYDNRVNTANPYSLSYPGYNEIFTGTTDLLITGNERKNNRNINVLEKLNGQTGMQGKVAIFTSWDMFPFILNQERNGLHVNSGPQLSNAGFDMESKHSSRIHCRSDSVTFETAIQHMQQNLPRVVVIGFGETDESAHKERYDHYLHHAYQADQMLMELWEFIQTHPFYSDRTSLLITTDHGRGSRQWSRHGFFVDGSSQTWLAMMGPRIIPKGEVKVASQIYNKQFASVIATLIGKQF